MYFKNTLGQMFSWLHSILHIYSNILLSQGTYGVCIINTFVYTNHPMGWDNTQECNIDMNAGERQLRKVFKSLYRPNKHFGIRYAPHIDITISIMA